MSPEIMESRPYDTKSDMWALGCVMYEAMSLRHAFDAEDMNGLVMKVRARRPPPPPPVRAAGARRGVRRACGSLPPRPPTPVR